MSTDDGTRLDMANPSASNIFAAAQRQVQQAFEDVGLSESSQMTGSEAFASTSACSNEDTPHLVSRITRDRTEQAMAEEMARKLAAEAERAQSTWHAQTAPQEPYPQATSPARSHMQVPIQMQPQSQVQTQAQVVPQAKPSIERQAQMQVDRIARNLGLGRSGAQRMAGSASQTRGAGRGAARSAPQTPPGSGPAASGGAHAAAKAAASKGAASDALEGVDIPHGLLLSLASLVCAIIAWDNVPSIGAGAAAVLAIWLGGRAVKASAPLEFLVNLGRFASWVVLIWSAFSLFVTSDADIPEVAELDQIVQEASTFIDDMMSDDGDPLALLDRLDDSERGEPGKFASSTNDYGSEQAKWCADASYVLTGERYRAGDDIEPGLFVVETPENSGYYAVWSGDSSENERILFNDFFAGYSIVEVREGETLELATALAYPIAAFSAPGLQDGAYGPGAYRVGSEIPAGEYRIEAVTGDNVFENSIAMYANPHRDIGDYFLFRSVQTAAEIMTFDEGRFIELRNARAVPL